MKTIVLTLSPSEIEAVNKVLSLGGFTIIEPQDETSVYRISDVSALCIVRMSFIYSLRLEYFEQVRLSLVASGIVENLVSKSAVEKSNKLLKL